LQQQTWEGAPSAPESLRLREPSSPRLAAATGVTGRREGSPGTRSPDPAAGCRRASVAAAPLLLVEPDLRLRATLAATLEERGHRVLVAASGQEAVALLEGSRAELVLFAQEQEERGPALVEAMRRTRHRPEILAIGPASRGQLVRDLLLAGASDFLARPLHLQQLHLTVDRLLAQRRQRRESLRLEEMVALYRVSERLDGSLELETLLRVLAEGVLELTGGSGARVVLALPGALRETVVAGTFPGGVEVAAAGGVEVRLQAGESYLGSLAALPAFPDQPLDEGHRKALILLAARAASLLENGRLGNQLGLVFRDTVAGLAAALEAKDRYTKGHSDRVRVYARLLAERLELDDEAVRQVEHAAGLHDIGKLGVHNDALNKGAPLTPAELDGLLDHPVRGAAILEQVTFLRELVPAVRHHHERWDGCGYPDKLAGFQIPLAARILAVVDAYDAMTADRPYRRAVPHAHAVAELRRGSGTQFDPELVELFLGALESFREACQRAGQWVAD